jgi:hypothetical protein
MEYYIKDVTDITYLCELTPHPASGMKTAGANVNAEALSPQRLGEGLIHRRPTGYNLRRLNVS